MILKKRTNWKKKFKESEQEFRFKTVFFDAIKELIEHQNTIEDIKPMITLWEE